MCNKLGVVLGAFFGGGHYAMRRNVDLVSPKFPKNNIFAGAQLTERGFLGRSCMSIKRFLNSFSPHLAAFWVGVFVVSYLSLRRMDVF